MNTANLTIDGGKKLEIVNRKSEKPEWVLEIVDDGYSCCCASVSDDGEIVLTEFHHDNDFFNAYRCILDHCHDDDLDAKFDEILYTTEDRRYYIRNNNGDNVYASMYVGDYIFGFNDRAEMSSDSLYSAIGCFCNLVNKNKE